MKENFKHGSYGEGLETGHEVPRQSLTRQMVRFYFPARIFCWYLDSTGSLDHTKTEEFRNRFGEKGARLITENMLRIAKEFGFTQPDEIRPHSEQHLC